MMKKSWPAALENIREISEFIFESALQLGCPSKKARQLELATEEIVTNIVEHAYPTDNHHRGEIRVFMNNHVSKMTLEFTDMGAPFNPLEDAPEPDITAGVPDRKVGGLGVFMVKRLVDEISYRRDADSNVLTLVKFF
jgi:sigma-B regulation protein RsbU (phosphoserine phosphatase)